MRNLSVLALEPYYGGSHKAFLNGWRQRSRHQWTLLTLPGRFWKWRMRHAAVTLASETAQLWHKGRRWDAVFCSDMLNLAEFRGLTFEAAQLPTVAYFHENQLTYPVRQERKADCHFAFTNFTTALAADAVWFNSAYHRDCFLEALPALLSRLPDFRPLAEANSLRAKARVEPPGIEADAPTVPVRPRSPGPLHIVWPARWEHDKNPEAFFASLRGLIKQRVPFRVSVLGESFRQTPPIFDQARSWLGDRIEHWGYLPSRREYRAALEAADVVVSTAAHEFFGIAILEAIAAGAYPLLPRRLAYPEVLEVSTHPQRDKFFFYSDSVDHLASCLARLAERKAKGALWEQNENLAEEIRTRYGWDRRASALDDALETLVANSRSRRDL